MNATRQLSFFFLHFWVFIGTLMLFYERYTIFSSMSVRGKGGLILFFTISASLIQCFILQVINRLQICTSSTTTNLSRREYCYETVYHIVKVFVNATWMFIKDFCFFFFLFIIEFLIGWICIGRFLVEQEMKLKYSWIILAVLPLGVILHKWFLEDNSSNEENNVVTTTNKASEVFTCNKIAPPIREELNVESPSSFIEYKKS